MGGSFGAKALLAFTAASCLTLMIFILLHSKSGRPRLEIQTPKDLAELEPQLRAYLAMKIEWARAAPDDAQRQAMLGVVYAANSLWQEARIAFQNSAKLNPNEPLAHLYVAIATQEIGDLPEALKLFKEVTVRFPDFPQGYYRLGEASLRAGVPDEAGTAFQRLIKLAPQEWRGYAGLGDVRLRQGNHAEAATLLGKAIQIGSDVRRAHYLLGLAYRGLGRLDDAKLELAIGIGQTDYPMEDAWSVMAPQHMKVLPDQLEMANEYSRRGQPRKAVEILSEAYAYQPENLSLANALAIAYNRSGQPEKARGLLLKAMGKNNRYLPAYITISHSCADLGLNEESLSYAERAIELGPKLAQSHLAKANALLAAEHDIEALAALGAAYRCDPENADIQAEMGDVCSFNLQRKEEALEHYQKAIELNPATTPVYVRLANLCLELGHTKQATTALKALRKLSPKEPELVELESQLHKLEQHENSK